MCVCCSSRRPTVYFCSCVATHFCQLSENPAASWRQRAWVRGSANPQSKLQQLLPTSTASEKHKKSHTYMIMLELLGPRAAETVKRISHGFPATQYGHKRESAQLWLAETKGRGQTVGHQSHIHKR